MGMAGVVVGAVAAYSSTDNAKGIKHFGTRSLNNNLENLKKISTYRMTMRSPINTDVTLGTFTYSPTGNGTINGRDAQDWIEDYYRTKKMSPVLVVEAGPIQFTNFYSETILPKDFAEYVLWFAKSVA